MKFPSIRCLHSCKPFILTLSLLAPFCLSAQQNYSEIYNSSEFISKGVQHFDQGDFEAALTEFNKVSKSDIFYLQAVYEKAYTLYASEKYDELQSLFDELEKNGKIKEFPSIYIIYGNYLSIKERFEDSEKKYKEAEKLIPNSNGLLYNMAIMYIRSEQRQKAVDTLKRLLEVNPNNAGAHYLLGLLAYEDGRVVEGSLGMLGYLLLSPEEANAGDAVLHLNEKMGSKYFADHKLKFSDKGDDFSELELILKNELPLSSKYKLKASIDDVYTRQLQAILEYMPTHKSKGGFFDTYYVPWLTEIAKRNYTEHFTYYTLSVLNDNIGKPLTSQKKKVEDFTNNFILQDFWGIYAKRNRMHFGKNEEVVIFLKDGVPFSQGKVVNGKSEGMYLYMDEDGNKTAEVNFLNDMQEGPQVYYYPNGKKSEEYTYVKDKKSGPFKTYYWNGSLRLEGGYLNDQYNGAFKSYYPNGGVYCEFNYVNGIQNGKNNCYWPNGTKMNEQNFVNGKADGDVRIFNAAGDKIREFNLKNGVFEGKDISYFDGKQIKVNAKYLNDEIVNNSQEFYENNTIKNESFYKNGKIEKYISYNLLGNKISESLYDSKGVIVEYNNYENNGTQILSEKYKNGSISKIAMKRPGTNEIEETDLKNGALQIKNEEGITIVEGTYKDYKMIGEWKYYYGNGNISSKKIFSNGDLNGLYHDYNLGGVLNFVQYFESGTEQGLYEGYKHDEVYIKIWNENNVKSGPYQYFFPGQKMEYEGFFVDDEKNYFHYDYYLNGNQKFEYKYVDDQLIEEKRFDNKGNLVYEFSYVGKSGNFEIKSPDNKVLKKMELKNGARNGLYVERLKDGTPAMELNFLNEKLHGPYKRFFPNGKVSMEGNYYANQAHGKFTYYDQAGNLRIITNYVFDKEYGTSDQYYPNGKIFLTYGTLSDMKNGEAKYYNLAGKLIASINYELDKPVSYRVLSASGELGEPQSIKPGSTTIESKYPNNRIAFKLQLNNWLKDGSLEIFEESGAPAYHSNYKNDKLHGSRISYHETGKVYRKENFVNGDHNGLMEIFDKDGKPEFSAEFFYDELHGEVKVYKNGNLEQTKRFDTNELVEVL